MGGGEQTIKLPECVCQRYENRLTFSPNTYTVNVDIFACTHVHVFRKIGNFAWIYFCVFDIIASI